MSYKYPKKMCPTCKVLSGEFKDIKVACDGQYTYKYRCAICGRRFGIVGPDPKLLN